MKTKGKAWQLVVTALLIVVFVYTAFFGVAAKYGDVTTTYIKGAKDIRFGVDIKGGVNVTFVPSDGYDATDEQLDAARLVIENRLVALNVTDYELYVDNNSDSLILEFPWQSGETDFDPEPAIQEIGTTAYLTFREGASKDGELILDGSMVESASAQYGAVSNGGSSEYYVALKFTTEGAKAFGDATTKLAADVQGGLSAVFLLYDPAGFEESTGTLRYLDGSLPEPGSDGDWWNMVYRWTDCPALTGLDLGEYQADTTHAQGGDSQEYMAQFYVGMRGAWNSGTADNLKGGEAFWQALTAGAVSTASAED